MKNVNKALRLVLSLFLTFVCFTSCEDFVAIDPPRTEVVSEVVFESPATMEAAINGIYSQIVYSNDHIFNAGLEVHAGLASDELVSLSTDPERLQFPENNLLAENDEIDRSFWRFAYTIIATCNTVIEGLENSPVVGVVKDQALGEALFVRALAHFYLTNLFGAVPYITTTDIDANALVTKEAEVAIYTNIVEDLLMAQSLMAEDYSFVGNEERVRPNRFAASAFLARVYLYRQDWENAELLATEVIEESGQYSLEEDLNTVFLPVSRETIWALSTDDVFNETRVGNVFVLPSFAPTFVWTNVLSDDFLNAFEAGDLRQTNWTDTVTTFAGGDLIHPFKYKRGFGGSIPSEPVEYTTVFRLAEMYLIRAEARAQQNNISGAIEDLNAIRQRAGLGDTPANNQFSLLRAIEQERRMELFNEWGHRWFDLKRTGRASEVLSALPGKDWQDTDVFWPLPARELIDNPNLLPQNPGYD